MKHFILLLSFIILSNTAMSQCFTDRHNSSWFDSWISCDLKANPNILRGDSHWIKYSFDSTYALTELKIWNINAPEFLDYGTKTAVIDYSLNGIDWIEFGTINLNQANGKNIYEGEDIFDLGGIEANYLLITSTSNYGGDCSGFSEIRIEAEAVELDQEIDYETCILAEVFPNPTITNELFVKLTHQCIENVTYKLIDQMGKIVILEKPISLNETKEVFLGKDIAPGVYTLVLSSNYASTEYKVVIT